MNGAALVRTSALRWRRVSQTFVQVPCRCANITKLCICTYLNSSKRNSGVALAVFCAKGQMIVFTKQLLV